MGRLFGISKNSQESMNNKQQRFINQDNVNYNEGYYNQGNVNYNDNYYAQNSTGYNDNFYNQNNTNLNNNYYGQDSTNFNGNYYNQEYFNNQNVINNQNYQNSETFVYNSVPSDTFYNSNMQNMNNVNYNNVENQNNMSNQYMNNVGNGNQQYSDYSSVNVSPVNDINQFSNSMSGYNQAELTNFSNNNADFGTQNSVSNINNLINNNNTNSVETLEQVELPVQNETTVVLDPLNNANNPVPVNPVAPKDDYVEEDLPTDVKANLFSVGGMMLGMILSPGTTIIKNSKKYRSINKALAVVFWISVISIILAMATRIVVGSFNTSYNSVSGFSSVYFDMSNIFNLDNYVPYFVIAVIMSLGAIVIASIVYYASSFLNSKGVHMGTYFMISSLAMVPIISGVLIFYQVASIISVYLGLLFIIFTFVYTLISFYVGMNEVLVFDSIDKRILYNSINLSIIFLVIILIFVVCFKLNVLTPPTLYF